MGPSHGGIVLPAGPQRHARPAIAPRRTASGGPFPLQAMAQEPAAVAITGAPVNDAWTRHCRVAASPPPTRNAGAGRGPPSRHASKRRLPRSPRSSAKSSKSETFGDAVRLKAMKGSSEGIRKTGAWGKTSGAAARGRGGPPSRPRPSRPRSTPDGPARADPPPPAPKTGQVLGPCGRMAENDRIAQHR
jgi:hypothetical protein